MCACVRMYVCMSMYVNVCMYVIMYVYTHYARVYSKLRMFGMAQEPRAT